MFYLVLLIFFLLLLGCFYLRHSKPEIGEKRREVSLPVTQTFHYEGATAWPCLDRYKVIIMRPDEKGESLVAIGYVGSDHVVIARGAVANFRNEDAMLAFTVYEKASSAGGTTISLELSLQSEQYLDWFTKEVMPKIKVPEPDPEKVKAWQAFNKRN